VDFTKSNSLNKQDLHKMKPDAGGGSSMYETAMRCIARTLHHLDDDQLIPAYGFGDSTTRHHSLFSLAPFAGGREQPCAGLAGVSDAYRQVRAHVQLSGGTSYAPAIYRACELCAKNDMQMHVLVILTDGCVDDAKRAQTLDAVAYAKCFPLSILLVGVGEGDPRVGWTHMNELDDVHQPGQRDNVDFVCWKEALEFLRSRGAGASTEHMDEMFGRLACKELPQQARECRAMGIIGASPPAVALPASWVEEAAHVEARRGAHVVPVFPPPGSYAPGTQPEPLPLQPMRPPAAAAPAPPARAPAPPPRELPPPPPPPRQAAGVECVICTYSSGEKQWGRLVPCGHAACFECLGKLKICHVCRTPVAGVEKIYL
jgi:E3 ubiquitin-protein ligase RGLG